jgi:5-formyltetrahydrofolate cyclo-ligase
MSQEDDRSWSTVTNFSDMYVAARRLSEMEVWKKAKVVKICPYDSQKCVRWLALKQGKKVLVSPTVSLPFMLLDPATIPPNKYQYASTTQGAVVWGNQINLRRNNNNNFYYHNNNNNNNNSNNNEEIVDLVVLSSVCAARNGARCGIGDGYAEIEYTVLKMMKIVNVNTSVVTTVHDVQVVEPFTIDSHDLPVDYIITPTQTIACEESFPRPEKIMWQKLSMTQIKSFPILMDLWNEST